MDAATTRFSSKHAFLLTAALIAAPAAAQAQLLVNGASTTSVTLGQSAAVNVTSSAAPVTVTPSVNYGTVAPSGWFSFSLSSTTTPATLYILLVNGLPSLGTYSGTIKLTDTSNASDVATINVTYTPGTSSGGGTLTASPTSLSFSTNPATGVAVNSPTVTLSTSGATAFSGTISLINNSAGSYLTLSATSFSVSATSPFSFYLIGSPYTPAGSYSATIQIQPTSGTAVTVPVTFTSASGTSASPSSVSLAYPGSPQSATSVVTTSGAQFTASASSSSGWLLVNGTTNTGYLPGGSTLTLSVNTAVAASLGTASYTGTVSVYATDGTQTTIFATLSVNGSSTGVVTISPSSVNFSVTAGSSSTQTQTVELTTATSGVFYNATVSTTTGTDWLTLSQYSGTLASGYQNNPLTIYAYPGGLSQGTYYGYVNLTYSSGATGSAQIAVVLNVGSGGGTGTGGLVAPTALTFWYQAPSGTQSLSSSILVNSTGTWTATSTGQSWLTIGTTGSAPGQPVSVAVNPAGLSVGSYSASITITSSSGTATVPVSLTVTSSMVATTNPGSFLVPSWTAGSPNPTTSVAVYASDNSSNAVTATPSASWITVTSPANPNTVATYGLTLNPSGLPNGLNSGSVTFTVANAADTTWVMPVAIIVNGNSNVTGPLTFSASSLAFNAAVGGTAPSQTLTVSSTSATTFSVSATSANGWLTVTPSGALNLPQTLTVSVSTAGLTQNGYIGYLNFTANGVSQQVQVNLSVGANVSGLAATPSSLSFSYTAGGTAPAAQSVNVTSTTGAPLNFTASASTSSGGSWLSVSPTSGTTSASISVSINPANLTAGSYSGTINLSTSGGTLSVPVTLTVTGAPPITASPTSLTFSYQAGGTAPNSQPITVSGSGSFTATATSNGNWLSVTPSSGTAPGTVTASVNPSSLTAGSYSGSIVVAGASGSTGSTTVTVTLTVTAPLPTITQLSNGASYASGAISPGEIITIFGTGLGPTTPLGLTLTSQGTVATTLGNVQVLMNGIASPLIYVSGTQVSAVVPYAISIFQTAQVYVNFLGQTSNAIQETVATTAPGLFTANSSGTGPGAILNQNLSVNSPTNQAAPGSVVVLYLTGEGQTSPAGVTGSVTQAAATPPYTPAPLLPVAALVNNSPATIEFYGEAPGLVAGVLQVNVLIPAGTPAGNVPIAVSIGGRSTQSGVTVSVQ
jgi:uncharacterized protein (TIGR03437 family)